MEATTARLLETLLLEGYPVWLLEDAEELREAFETDEAFGDYRSWPTWFLDEVREDALQDVNTVMVEV